MIDSLDRLKAALADRYSIIRELGRGGMATVYLAEDLKHHRNVAVKVLHAEVAASLGTERFLREIDIAARLMHPNILPLHDSGDVDGLPYYVMPYVEGESLRERLSREKQLPLDHAIEIARQVADALSYAHSHGVIHRDIKPENILFAAGRPLISDFGIAKAVDAAGSGRLTETGLAVGTPAYMSPEQANGDHALDQRSDIYSFACVVYEMLGGAPPFTGPSPQAVRARHLLDPVPSVRTLRPTVPQGLQRALENALAKVPADRFVTATLFAEALEQGLTSARAPEERSLLHRHRRVALAVAAPLLAIVALLVALNAESLWTRVFDGAGAPRIESIAVLPLENFSGDPGQEYFSDGLTDALITDLAKIGGLRVISRSSVMRYKRTDRPLREIARELGVDALIEGSAQRVGNEVRVTVRLVDPATTTHVWAENYTRNDADVLEVPSEVALAIARRINVTLTVDQERRLASTRTVNPEVYEAYLRGTFYLNQGTDESIRRGLEYLRKAVETDPADPLAYAGLALGYSLSASHGPSAPADAFRLAKGAANQALRLDETLAEAHAALAQIHLYQDWDWPAAEQAFLRALELNPSLPPARAHYAMYLSLFGRRDEALDEIERAHQLDPLNPLLATWIGDIHWGWRKYDKAIELFQKSLEVNPDFPWALRMLGFAYAEKRMYAEAIAVHKRAVAANPSWNWALARSYALAGRREEARQIAAQLRETKPVNARGLAVIHTALGEKDEAFRWLEAAYEQRDPVTPWLDIPLFEPLRDDRRFDDLLRRLRVPRRTLVNSSEQH